jgi:hypothetical protein
LYIFCTKPPVSVLFCREDSKTSKFQDLEADIIPVFPSEQSITIKQYSIQRKQVPIYPVFSFTDYKVQGSILTTAILDLKYSTTIKRQDSYRNFCLIYIQLLQLRSLDRLYLLQKIEIEDIYFCLYQQLLLEIKRLKELELEIMSR